MKKIRVLLVDDMEWVYESTRLELGETYDIVYAKTEKEALCIGSKYKRL